MPFDPSNNTIHLTGSDAKDFQIEVIVFFAKVLGDLAKDPAAKPQIQRDAETLNIWLREDITNLSTEGQIKLKTAYLAYLSLGRAPSYSEQALFDHFASRQNAKEQIRHKPPAEILNIFDRMLASDTEIKEKKEADYKAHTEKLSQVVEAARVASSSSQPKAKPKFVSKWWHKCILLSVLWVAWVYIRTATNFELLGYYFERWDDDMFLINALIVPIPLFLFGWWKNRGT